jgi:hypothetical protein
MPSTGAARAMLSAWLPPVSDSTPATRSVFVRSARKSWSVPPRRSTKASVSAPVTVTSSADCPPVRVEKPGSAVALGAAGASVTTDRTGAPRWSRRGTAPDAAKMPACL